jgi:hypothetical protein
MKATEAIRILERIAEHSKKPETQKKARFYITELMEDIIDREGDFELNAPLDEYLSEITPPPHDGEPDRMPYERME